MIDEKSQNWNYKYSDIKIEDKDESELRVDKPNYVQEYITTAISSCGMFLLGLTITWIGPILPTLLSGTFKIHITMKQSVWVMSLGQIGGIPGSIIASYIANNFGRKNAILLISIPYIISSIIIIFAENVWHYYIARFIAGLSGGATFAVIPMYVSEIASPEIRGLLSTSVYMSFKLAFIVAYIAGSYLPIVKYSIVCGIFPIIMFIFSFYLPETPYYYLIKQDIHSAEKSLKFLRKKSNVRIELDRLIEGHREEIIKGKQSFWDLFRLDSNRKCSIIVFGLVMAQQWTGGMALISYCQVVFKDGHSSISVESCGILLALTSFIVVTISSGLVDRLGRRKLLYISYFCQLIPLSALGVYFYLQDIVKADYIEHLRLTPLIGLVVLQFTFAIGISPIPTVLLGELFPTSVRAQAGSFLAISGSLLGTVGYKMFQLVYTDFGYPPTFGMFFVLDILAIIFIYFMVPETKGLALEEIQTNLKKSRKEKK